ITGRRPRPSPTGQRIRCTGRGRVLRACPAGIYPRPPSSRPACRSTRPVSPRRSRCGRPISGSGARPSLRSPHTGRAALLLRDERLQVAGACRVAQADERLFLDLAHALARDAEERADLLQRHGVTSLFETVVEPEHAGLALLQRVERFLDRVAQRALIGLVVGAGRELVGQVVEQAVVLAGRQRGIQRQVGLRDCERALHLLVRQVELLGDLLDRGLAPQLLQQGGRPLPDAVQRSCAVERHAHDAALLGQRLQDGLPDPPDGVRDELDALRLVELVGGPDQAEVALVDQVAERHALVLVLLGDGYDEAEVGADELIERFFVALADPLGQLDLVLALEQRIRADLLEVLIERALFVAPAFTTRRKTHTTLR